MRSSNGVGDIKQKSASVRRRILASCVFAGFVGVLGLGGCSTLGYYQQAVSGQLRLLSNRRSVSRLLAEPSTDAQLARQLRVAQEALGYAREELGLKVGKRYGSYSKLKGDFVVWNLVVASPDSVQPRQWCFPVAGCVSYRGYFNEARARRVAEQFKAQGYDVYVGGVAAYSTLGWFNDPLLSSFIYWPRPALVQLLLHELAHGELYVPGDTEFNESFASFVAERGISNWLLDDAQLGPEVVRQRQRRAELNRFNALLIRLRSRLKQDFGNIGSNASVLDIRVERYAQARECVRRWSAENAIERFNKYFAEPPNMARLALAAAYNRWIPAFDQLFVESRVVDGSIGEKSGGNWPAFYAAAARLGDLPIEQRQIALQRLHGSGEARLQQQIKTPGDHNDPGEIRCEALADHVGDGDVAG